MSGCRYAGIGVCFASAMRLRAHRREVLPNMPASLRVAPQVWCKSHGRRLRLMMLRGGCDGLVDHLLRRARGRPLEQVVAQVLELADDLGGHLDATPAT
jgi:hypothetical protein